MRRESAHGTSGNARRRPPGGSVAVPCRLKKGNLREGRGPRLEFVADLPQHLLPGRDLGVALDPLRLRAVDYAEDAAALLRFGEHDLNGIRRGAEDAADFGDAFDGIKHVNGKRVPQEDDEAVSRREGEGVLL